MSMAQRNDALRTRINDIALSYLYSDMDRWALCKEIAELELHVDGLMALIDDEVPVANMGGH